jgi:GNAT superfamily N-acetyltransferase
MPIRLATIDDLPALVEGGSRVHALTRFKSIPFSAQKTAESFAALIRHKNGKYVFLVAENSAGKVVGCLIGVVEQPLFSNVFVATVMYIVVLPESRMGGYAVRLIRAFELWAKNRNVVEIQLGVNSALKLSRTSELLGKLNYEKVGGNFVKKINLIGDMGRSG